MTAPSSSIDCCYGTVLDHAEVSPDSKESAKINGSILNALSDASPLT